MRFNGKYKKRVVKPSGEVEVTFTLPYFSDRQKAQDLEVDKTYRIEATPLKDKRTLEQNALMWVLIHEIAQEVNTKKATQEDEWDIYINILQNANAKSQDLVGVPEAYPLLQKNTRAVKILNKFIDDDGKEKWTYRCFDGSSQLDKEEMGKLLDLTIDMAAALGIEVEV